MPVTGETPHHIPGNPSPGDIFGLAGIHDDPELPHLAISVSADDLYGLAGFYTVADQPKYAVRGNPEPGSIMSGS